MKKIIIIATLLLSACSQTNWKPIDNENRVYEGFATIEGTFTIQPQYINDESPHIKVDQRFLPLLPRQDKDTFMLSGSAHYPEEGTHITVHATKIQYPMEGSPIINYSEIE